MSARSRSNSNLCLRFDGTEIESQNHTDFDNLSCERVVAKPTGDLVSTQGLKLRKVYISAMRLI